jgi:hypothetical protein
MILDPKGKIIGIGEKALKIIGIDKEIFKFTIFDLMIENCKEKII